MGVENTCIFINRINVMMLVMMTMALTTTMMTTTIALIITIYMSFMNGVK